MIKNAYLRKMETKLREWDEDIASLTAKAEKATAEARTKLNKQIEVLRSKRTLASDKLREVREAGTESWGKLKVDAERAFEDLKKALDEAIARFRKSA
ncbi:MAG: coiled coil domain-containing protein [Deltaproteobacteria bacterium]|nr:coiled coil domain-containing protein [Deltaproteobacteria bacterium]